MSRLDHPNVVRYYSSWLEYVPKQDRLHTHSRKKGPRGKRGKRSSLIQEDTWEEDSLDQATIDSPLSLTADSDSYSEDEEEEDEESHVSSAPRDASPE